jgi:transcriptional regulator with XRE-family HTH domain
MKQFNNIRHFREFRGYSQKYVAQKLGKSQPALSKIERALTQVSHEITDQLSKILEVPTEKLYSNEQLILDCKNNPSSVGSYKTKIFSGDEKVSLPSLKNMGSILFNQLSENKHLLHKLELNQEKLQRQLNAFISMLNAKKETLSN